MAVNPLTHAVFQFTALTQGYSVEDLEKPWKWGDFEEGVRFTFFRVYDCPEKMPDEQWTAFWEGDPFEMLAENGPLSAIMDYFNSLHGRVLQEFANISRAELSLLVFFWESIPFPVEFRLHRFDSHLRQHSIQLEKMRVQLNLLPTETHRLLRLIFAALAEVEGLQIGAPSVGLQECLATAEAISARTLKITQLT